MPGSRIALVVLVLFSLLVPAGAASAHDELTGTEPVGGATVEAPDELLLTFSGQLSDLGAQVAVTGPDGASVADGAPQVDGTTLEQDLVDDLAAGEYAVVWRVTSEDGHPISGEFGFTIEQSTEEPTTEEPTTEEPTTEEPSATAVTEDAAGEPAEASSNPQGGGGLPGWVWVLVALAAVGLLGLLMRRWVRRPQ